MRVKEEDDKKVAAKPFRYQFGCLMASLNIKNWKKLHTMIAPEDIYGTREEGFGKETEPHVTILFGFEEQEGTAAKLQAQLPIKGPIKVPLVKLSYFENKDFDVLKFDVESEDLNMLNAWCRDNFKYKSDHPNYHPHVTLCYLKKGMGKKYAREMRESAVTIADKLVYSEPTPEGKKKTKWDINKKEA